MLCFPISPTHTTETRKSFFCPLFNIKSFLHPIIVYSHFPSLSFFSEGHKHISNGCPAGAAWKTSLVLESVGKQHGPPAPPTTTVSPQERTHREASMGWASKDLTAQALLGESRHITLATEATSRCAVKDPGKFASFHGAELLSRLWVILEVCSPKAHKVLWGKWAQWKISTVSETKEILTMALVYWQSEERI